MKFAICLENTQNSLELLDLFFEKIRFCPKFNLDVFSVQEIEDQETEMKELKKIVEKRLKKEKVSGKFIVKTGEPVETISKLIEKEKIDVVVCKYEHSLFSHTFFEQIVKNTQVPILILR